MAQESTGRRQGTAEMGFLICPHTCGCVISQAAANKSRKKPKWLRQTPVFLKAGSHLPAHSTNEKAHPNCNPACQGFQMSGRSLTDAENTAWVPHLGNWRQLHQHIPPNFRHLIPPQPLEDGHQGIPPNHPLPNTSVQSIQQGMGFMSMQPEASTSGPSNRPYPPPQASGSVMSMQPPSGPSNRPYPHAQASGSVMSMQPPSGPSNRPYPHAQASGSVSSSLGERKCLFIESPRARGLTSAEEAAGFVSYDRYLMTEKTTKPIRSAILSAPKGLVFKEPPTPNDRNPGVVSYQIHDMVSVL